MKHLLTIVILAIAFLGCSTKGSYSSKSSQPQPYWIKDQNGCKHWNPVPGPKETITWTGECVNGYAEGYGTQQWYADGIAGTKTVGTMKKGLSEGKGVAYQKDGAKYVGEFKNGKSHGQGMYYYGKSNVQIGEFRNAKAYDVETYIIDKNGCKIYNPYPQKGEESITWSGQCTNGYANGYGKVVWYLNGLKEEVDIGTIKNGKFHGTLDTIDIKDNVSTNEYQNGTLIKKLKTKEFGENLSLNNFINSPEYKYFYSGLKFDIVIDKEKPFIYIKTKNPKKIISLIASDNNSDLYCSKTDTTTYTRNLGIMEQLLTAGISHKATVTKHEYTCEFSNGYKNRMRRSIMQLNPSNLSSVLNSLEQMKHWRRYSTSENWGVKDFIMNAARNAANNSRYENDSSSSSSYNTTKDVTSNSKTSSSSSTTSYRNSSNSSCSYKINRIKNTDTPRKSKGKQVKCSNGEYITIALYYKNNQWKKESEVILPRWFDSFDEAAEHACGCD